MTDSRTAPTVDSAPGWLTRLLRTFGDISASETRDVVVMFFNIFMLLVAYYVLKTVREPLVLLTGGAELKSYAAAAQAAVLLLYVPAYGMLAARLPVSRLVTGVNLAMAGMIELFFVLGYAWVRRRGSGQRSYGPAAHQSPASRCVGLAQAAGMLRRKRGCVTSPLPGIIPCGRGCDA